MATRFAPPCNINILSLLLTKVIYLWYVCISLAWILCPEEDFWGVTHYFHLDSSQKQLRWLEQKDVTVWGCCALELCACLHLQLSCAECQCSACQPEVPHLEGIKKSKNTAINLICLYNMGAPTCSCYLWWKIYSCLQRLKALRVIFPKWYWSGLGNNN